MRGVRNVYIICGACCDVVWFVQCNVKRSERTKDALIAAATNTVWFCVWILITLYQKLNDFQRYSMFPNHLIRAWIFLNILFTVEHIIKMNPVTRKHERHDCIKGNAPIDSVKSPQGFIEAWLAVRHQINLKLTFTTLLSGRISTCFSIALGKVTNSRT